jgi:hypothetical protein
MGSKADPRLIRAGGDGATTEDYSDELEPEWAAETGWPSLA